MFFDVVNLKIDARRRMWWGRVKNINVHIYTLYQYFIAQSKLKLKNSLPPSDINNKNNNNNIIIMVFDEMNLCVLAKNKKKVKLCRVREYNNDWIIIVISREKVRERAAFNCMSVWPKCSSEIWFFSFFFSSLFKGENAFAMWKKEHKNKKTNTS